MSSLIPLCRRGEAAEGAWLVRRGPVYMELDSLPRYEIVGENLVAGALELLLRGDEQGADDPSGSARAGTLQRNASVRPSPEGEKSGVVGSSGRLFDLFISSDDVVRPISEDSIEDLLLDYDLGFSVNVCLSQMLEGSNAYHLAVTKQLTQEVRKYRVRAIHYAELLNDLYELLAMPVLRPLEQTVQAAVATDLYADGCLFSREHRVRAISVSPHTLAELIQGFKKNSEICREGSRGDAMYVLLKGRVAVSVDGKYIASITEPGEAFGEAFLFLDGRRGASLTAESDTKVYVLRKDNLLAFYSTHRDLFANIAKTFARRIKDNVHRSVRFMRLLGLSDIDRHSADRETWQQVRSLHDELVQIQRRIKSETLHRVLLKHSVGNPTR